MAPMTLCHHSISDCGYLLDSVPITRKRLQVLSSARLYEAAARLSAAAFKTHPDAAGIVADRIVAVAALKRSRDAYAAVRRPK